MSGTPDPDADLFAAGAVPVADPDADLFALGGVPVAEQPAPQSKPVSAPAQPPAQEDGGAPLTFLQGVSRYAGGDLIREGLNKVETYAQQKMIDAGLVDPQIARDYDVFQEREQVLANKKANPVAAGVGEVAGVVGQAVATGGASLMTPAGAISKATTAVGERLAAKALGQQAATGLIAKAARKGAELAAQGAAEGAVYGAASELNDAYLRRDYDHLVEKTLAGAAGGAATGAIAAPIVGAAFSMVGKVARAARNAQIANAAADAPQVISTKTRIATQADDMLQLEQRAAFDTAISQHIDETARLSNQVDGESMAAMDLSLEPIYMQRGALVSRDIAEAEISKAQKAFAAARAAEGGFEQAQQKGVREIADDFNKLMAVSKKVDRYAGISAKRRAVQEFDGVVDSTRMPDSTRQMLADVRERAAAMEADFGADALNNNGGLLALRKIRSSVNAAEKQADALYAQGKVGSATMVLDDMKRDIGRLQSTKSQEVRRLIEGETGYDGLYGAVQRELQREDILGEFATVQAKNNASWTEKIRRSMDQQIQRFFISKSGEVGASPWESATLTNRESLGGFLKSLGDEEAMGVEEAFRRFVRSAELDARNRASTWGSAELAKEADEITKLVDRIETNMNAVALSRSNAQAWNKATRDIGDVPVIGSTIKGVLRVGQKLTGKSAAETTRATTMNVNQRVDMGATATSSRRAQTVVESAATVASRKAAVTANKTLQSAPDKFLQRIKTGSVERAAESGGAAVKSSELFDEARQLSDPNSEASQDLGAYLMDLEAEDPDMAQAMAAKISQRVEFMLDKAGPDPVNAMGYPTKRDPVTVARLDRYARAVVDPAAAIGRIAAGVDTAEDRETVEQLYPSLWGEFVERTVSSFDGDDITYDARVRASIALGIPLDDSMSAENIAFTQSRMPSAESVKAKANNVDMGAQAAPLTSDRITFQRS